MLGKIEDRRRGQQSMRWLDSTTDSMDTTLSKLRETVKDIELCAAVTASQNESDMTKQLNDNNKNIKAYQSRSTIMNTLYKFLLKINY